MRFSRARYVTLCQQSLVTAAVLAVGVSAAGVKTLDIVPQPGQTADLGAGLPGTQPPRTLAEAGERPAKARVDAVPVTPKVREVKVTGSSAKAPKAARTTPPAAPEASRQADPQDHAHATETPESPKRVVALSDPEPVRGYATVGVTWKHGTEYADDQIDVNVRTEKNGTWSHWMPADYHDEHGPDAGSSEDNTVGERPGTDALVVGDVDRVQMRAATTDGSAPPDLRLAVIDPGTGAMTKEAPAIDTGELGSPTASSGSSTGGPQALSGEGADLGGGAETHDTVALSAMKRAPLPKIFSRSQWGANERLRERGAPDYGTVKAGFIHHTVNSNSYSQSQVPSLLRGIYAYHTQSRGWRDIGYNYLVDRFGRIWEGRAGGVDRAVVGAHTLGYNEYSFALSAIGNYDVKSPPSAVLKAYAQLFAWKLSKYNIKANNPRVLVKNRYFHAISGHRDAGQTACPGRYLYAKLPSIRSAAQSIQHNAQTPATPTKPAVTPFTSPTQTPLAAKTQPGTMTFLRTRNLSGSAYPDIALKDAAGRVSILPTGGQLGYSAPVYTKGNWHRMSLVSAVGDVTGDGRGDVVGRWPSQGKSFVYRGTGDGRTRIKGVAPTAVFRTAGSVVAAKDWDADGRNDVLMRTAANSRLWLVRGLGSGKFATPRQLADRKWAGYTSIAATGDLDRDGGPDLVGLHKNGYLYFIPGSKSGALGAARSVRDVGTTYTGIVGSGDMSGDGMGDIAARDRTGAISVLTGNGAGGFRDTLGKFTGPTSLRSLSGAPMAGSAHPDLVGLDATRHQLVMLKHSGRTNLNARVATNVTVPGATQLLTVGDWNRDGKQDLVTREGEGDRLLVRIGKGNGQYAAGTSMDNGWKPFTYLAAVGDVTGDRNPDLVGAKSAAGPFTVFPGNGKASFLAPTKAPSSLRTFNQIGTGSWAPASAKPTYISSDGSFVPVLGSLGADPAAYDWVVGPGDVDGDGRADLITRDAAGSLWLVPGKDKGFGPRRLMGSGYGAFKLGG